MRISLISGKAIVFPFIFVRAVYTAPQQEPGQWYLYSTTFDAAGNATVTTHLVTAHVHSHPMNGNENTVSSVDETFAKTGSFPGMPKYILNQNNLVKYNETGDAGKTVQSNPCK